MRAVLFAVERARLVAEPVDAAGIAAVMQDPGSFEPPVVALQELAEEPPGDPDTSRRQSTARRSRAREDSR